jgi:signal transduction histidine kinase/ligand-binding sensor domain-containing protein/DNA-binding response OmpR family regulator
MTISYRSFSVFILFVVIGLGVENILPQSLLFNHLTVEDGLSNNNVNTLIQDRTGFIWFGTEDGLNRFDGYNFKVYSHNPSDSNSISDNNVWALLEDKRGNIWIGTKGGVLNKFNPLTEKFFHWIPEPIIKENNSISALCEDSKGNIWIGTRNTGVYKLDLASNEFSHWDHDTTNNESLSHFSIRSIAEDHSGKIIIGTYHGLNILDPDSIEKGFKRFYFQSDNPNSLSRSQIYNLSKSSFNRDIIWIGTARNLTEYNSATNSFRRIEMPNPEKLQFGSGASTVIEELDDGEQILWVDTYSGLVRMNLTNGESIRFIENKNDPFSLIDNQINKIIKDSSGVLWIATKNGVSYLSPKTSRFNSLLNKDHSIYLNAVENKKNLRAITKNENGTVWLGFSNGLVSIKNIDGTILIDNHSQFNSLNIWSLAADRNKSLWIGTYGQGLKQYNLNSGIVTNWIVKFPETDYRTSDFIKSLFFDRKNNLWIGYWGSGLGRITPDGSSYVWRSKLNNSNELNSTDVWLIKEDYLDRIWLGTQGGGLNLFIDKDSGIFKYWTHQAGSSNTLSSNDIFSLHVAKNIDQLKEKDLSVLWVGTSNGLNEFTIKEDYDTNAYYNFSVQIKNYSINDGLPDNYVYSILEDDEGNLWLGTGDGISFFDVTTETFTNFSPADGLNGTVMNPESAIKLDNGLMIFGSTKGLNIFDPEKIKLSDYIPPIVITDFQIFNVSVSIGENSSLRQSIISSDEIILSHNQNVFSIEFAALDYNSPKSIQYAYKMDGFDREWIYSSNRRFVTYTNLDPGEYTFQVKSTNADGVWNDQVTALSIIMNPPWWKTFWAYGLYVVLIFIGLIAIRRFELNRAKMRNELKLREFEVRKKTELENLKSRFFANLSHEFRTPLMLIKGPLEQLKSGQDNRYFFENINLIEKNSRKLQELIDQLLELSQIEKAAIPLKAKQENLISILKGLVSSFKSLADQKNISLKFESESESICVWIDRDNLEKIIDNLLSNALKFTPSGGEVIVGVNETQTKGNRSCEIKITDSGIGIPEDKLEKIFDRFFQVDDSTQRNYGGSGIGLALVKELVDLHKWSISVQSEPEKGTEFKLTIPMWDYLDAHEKIITDSATTFNDARKFKQHIREFNYSTSENKRQNEIGISINRPSVLIVDDSEDVRRYLSNLLEEYYEVSEADNGESGIKAATENLPDLIISDIMMPSMDGIEFCNRIKSEWQTSDIPVILLTAKASFESRIEGLEIGADDYLTKPFDSRELFTRIKNLLEQRKRLREKYSKNLNQISQVPQINEADKEFMSKAYDLVQANLDKTTFSTENLAKELFLSRSQLHRKMMTITGQAPGDFIRTIKLKEASRMLLEKKLSVTQVAYEIGFSSPAQFTRAFTKQFNCLPSEYSARNKN